MEQLRPSYPSMMLSLAVFPLISNRFVTTDGLSLILITKICFQVISKSRSLRQNACNGYDTIQLLQPQSLFSIFVYPYLQTDFSPFTTTPVLIPLLLHNRKRSSVLVGLKVLGFLHFFTLLAPPWRSYCV